MRVMRWIGCWFFLAWLTAAAALPSAQTARRDPPLQAFFGPRAADDPEGVYFNLVRFLDSAQQNIYGSVHEVDMIAIAELLAAKADKGLDVHIVVENDWWGGAKNKAARQVLEQSKVKVHPDTKASGLMHNKFFIVDRRRVWTGSTNLTQTCLLYNPNNAVWIEDRRVAANFFVEFDEQRAGKFGKKGSGPNNTPYPLVNVAGSRVETYFSPEDLPIPAIIRLLDGAKERIEIMCFVFSSKEISDAVIKAHKRGVKVRVLLDNAFSLDSVTKRWESVPYKELRAAGVEVKFDDERSKLHHKVIIVDGRSVMTGSFNLSTSAAQDNDENVVILHDRNLARQFLAEFERWWLYYTGDPGDPPPLDKEDGDG